MSQATSDRTRRRVGDDFIVGASYSLLDDYSTTMMPFDMFMLQA